MTIHPGTWMLLYAATGAAYVDWSQRRKRQTPADVARGVPDDYLWCVGAAYVLACLLWPAGAAHRAWQWVRGPRT